LQTGWQKERKEKIKKDRRGKAEELQKGWQKERMK
jgi:hypothetical protein